jgi:hypothetical protein
MSRNAVNPAATKMRGFGIPDRFVGRSKRLPASMEGPPYFYFENVAGAPKSEWETIQRHFNGVEPEFVDSMFFSACRRARGYVHNLPVEERELILPTPAMTISEALPNTVKFKPHWDTREKLNCIKHRESQQLVLRADRPLLQGCRGSGEYPSAREARDLASFEEVESGVGWARASCSA